MSTGQAKAGTSTVSSNVISGGGDITLTADTIVVQGGVTISAMSLGTITINANEDYLSDNTSTLEGAEIVFNIDVGDSDVGGGVANIRGDLNASMVTLFGGFEDDVFNISLDNNSPINVDGSTGFDVLDLGGIGTVNFLTATSGTISAPGFATMTFSNVEQVLGVNAVPEPASLAIFGFGGLGLFAGGVRRSKRKRSA